MAGTGGRGGRSVARMACPAIRPADAPMLGTADWRLYLERGFAGAFAHPASPAVANQSRGQRRHPRRWRKCTLKGHLCPSLHDIYDDTCVMNHT